MVNIGQVKAGAQKYIELEFVSKMQGWQKWAFGAASALFLENIPQIFEELKTNQFVKALGVIDDQGRIDLDKLYERFRAEAEKGPVTIDMPMIGPVTLNKDDVTKIYQMISSS